MSDFLEPIQADKVAGENAEYDEEFLSLMALLQDRPEQQFGDVLVEASVKDWNAIHQTCRNILAYKSKDLSVMGYFTQSAIALRGAQGLAEGLHIIAKNIEHYWEEVFPRLVDEDGDYDPDFRINALSIFFAYDGLIKELKQAPLVKNGLSGKFYQLRDIEEFLDTQQVEYPGGAQRLAIDLKIAMDDEHSPVRHLQNAYHSIQAIKSTFQSHDIHEPLKFDALEQLTLRVLALLEEDENDTFSPSLPADVALSNPTQPVAMVNNRAESKPNWANYPISSREDAEFLLEKICLYFEKHEPSHPAPLFIRRIQKLMNLNFYEIMRDISPESLDRLDTLVGQPVSTDDDF